MQQAFPCPRCGAQIPVGQQFCATCGQHFQYRCRYCGSVINSLSGFCTRCGAKLQEQTQTPAEPVVKQAPLTHQKEKTRHNATATQPVGQVARYLILVAIIIFIGTILYVIGTGPQGGTSNWLGGKFVFGGQSPPSIPPDTNTQQKPEPTYDLPSYTVDQVVAEARRISPHCRLSTRQGG